MKNELLGSADPHITILFVALWMMADREGRLEDRPLRICAEAFPYRRRVTEKRVDAWLTWLHDNSLIARYIVEGRRFIQVLAFSKHQNPHKDEKASAIPALSPISHGASTMRVPEAAPCTFDKSPELVGLTPDSGLLTADCSLREERARDVSRGAQDAGGDRHGARAHAGTARPDPHELIERIKAIYPPGTFANANWILAERAVGKLLESGENPADLERLAGAYRAQQDAKGSTGTQFVKSPEKFFGPDGHWRGPFPLPSTPESRAATSRADSERIEWQNLEERAARVGFRKRLPVDDLSGYRTLVERAEANQPRASNGARPLGKLFASPARPSEAPSPLSNI